MSGNVPGRPPAGGRALGMGVGIYALFAWLSTAAQSAGATLMVLVALADRHFRASLLDWRTHGIWWLLALGVTAAAARGAWLWPETADAQWQAALGWIKVLLFLPLAWWLRADPARAGRVLALALAGWWLGFALHVDWVAWTRFEWLERTGFQFKILLSGLVASIVLLGLALLYPVGAARAPLRRLALVVVWMLVAASALLALFAAQSRGAWLAFLLVFPAAVAWRWLPPRAAPPVALLVRRVLLALVIALPLAGLAVWSLQVRWAQSPPVMPSTPEIVAAPTPESAPEPMPAESVPESVSASPADAPALPEVTEAIDRHLLPSGDISLHLRAAVQRYGLEKWAERRWLGWGPGATDWLIEQGRRDGDLRDAPESGVAGWLAHFHNTALEILVQFGVVGAALFAAALGLTLVRLARAGRHAGAARGLYLFAFGALVMYGVMSLTNFSLSHRDSRSLLILLLGLAWGLGGVSERRT